MLRFEVVVYPTKDIWEAHMDSGEVDGVGAYSLGGFMASESDKAEANARLELDFDPYMVVAYERR